MDPNHVNSSPAPTHMLKPYFPGGSHGKEFACNAGDLGSIAGLGRSPGEGKGHNHLWKVLKEMGKPDHLTCLLRSLYAGRNS